jgi:hypothetical protein
MKISLLNLLNKVAVVAALAATSLFFAAAPARAVNYIGNGNTSFGGDIGNGVLTLTDDGTNITGSIICGNGGNMFNALVIYIDTGVGGGFNSTSNFNDQVDENHIAICGVDNGNGRSVLTFTNGFAPQYAISLIPADGANFGGIWQLTNGGNGSLTFITSVGLTPVNTTVGPFTFSFPASAIGLTNNTQATIKLFGTYISTTAFRSQEAIAGNIFGSLGAGWNPFTQTAYATYNFSAPPATLTPVTFQVDMSEQIANGNFNPANGDTVSVSGSFETNVLGTFQLTPMPGDTNIYTGTFQDANPVGTAEQFQYQIFSVSGDTTTVEDFDKRPFTLAAGGQVLPLVYFDDVAPSTGVPVHNVTFSIDLSPQIQLGNYNPVTDAVEVFGTFQNPMTFAITSAVVLTNNPNGANTNLYSGTYPDGNHIDSFEEYKFVIATNGAGSGNYNFETSNRQFFTPTNNADLMVDFFNNVTNVFSTPVTFSVDMTIPLEQGEFNPANGDTCGAAGTFQNPTFTVGPGGFLLTNNPTATDSNVYSGVFMDHNPPGVLEQYKFVINPNGGNTIFESPTSTDGGNRSFQLGNLATNLPVVFWNDENTDQVLPAATYITFTINMTNAVDEFGNPFNPNNDAVLVDGNWVTPAFPVLSDATDPTILDDFPNNFLTNNPIGSTFYSQTFLVPPGTPVQVTYKYGIYHNVGALNTNVDNEAPFGDNHVRYIRTLGSYKFPVDTFGIQLTNPAAATEISFGNLAIGSVSAGELPITWLGRPGVLLQVSTNLLNNTWQSLNSSDGLMSTNFPRTSGNEFFRLVLP